MLTSMRDKGSNGVNYGVFIVKIYTITGRLALEF